MNKKSFLNKRMLVVAMTAMTAFALQAQTWNESENDAADFHLSVAGMTVTESGRIISSDADNQILGDITFDADTRTLTLDNAIINTLHNAIESNGNLTIRLVGENRIVVDSDHDIFALALSGQQVTITSDDGKGSLLITGSAMDFGSSEAGFQSLKLGQETALTLDNISVVSYEGMIPDLTSATYRKESAHGHLTINRTNLDFRTGLDDDTFPVFGYFASVTLTNSKFSTPSDGEYDVETGFVMSEESEYDGYWYTDIRIVREEEENPTVEGYVQVAGLRINTTTAEVVPTAEGSVISSGTVSFDADTQTLTLDNVYIKCYIEDEYNNNNMEDGIYANLEGLTIRLIGDNTIYYGWGHGMVFDKDATITSDDGTGSLHVITFNSNSTYGDALLVDADAKLTLKDVAVKIGAPVNLAGDDEDFLGGTLAVDNATLIICEEARYGYWGYLKNVTSLLLNDAEIDDPDDHGIHFSDDDHYLAEGTSGKLYKGPIAIQAKNTSVAIRNLNSPTPQLPNSSCYNISGQPVTAGTQNLPKGIYIVGGKKFVVK